MNRHLNLCLYANFMAGKPSLFRQMINFNSQSMLTNSTDIGRKNIESIDPG